MGSDQFDEAKEAGNLQRQKEILTTLGSNLVLKDKILRLEHAKPFAIIQDAFKEIPEAMASFEPVNKR